MLKHFTTLATAAALAAGFLSVGCGMSPAYEPEPRMPVAVAYGAAPNEYPDPATSEELQEQANARAQAQGEVAVGTNAEEYSDTDPSALTEFKPALEGHGQWVDDSTYGTVWVPSESEVGSDFEPYTTAGHWTYDDSTNYVWVSDYSWGWAPFHYGRWIRAGHHGWAWIPGRTYAGAWVTWRSGGPDYAYVGWAPTGPDWYWYNGYAVGWTFGYAPYYSYCQRDYFYDHHVGGHVIRGSDPRSREYDARTRPYSPASPTVGRVAANPSVGPGRVAASPRVGPSPSELGIARERVVPPPIGNAGLARAQAFAAPRTAVAAGALAPAQTRRRTLEHDGVAGGVLRANDARGPVMSSRIDAVARAPQVAGVSPVPQFRASAPLEGSRSARSLSEQQANPSYRAPSPQTSYRVPSAVSQPPTYRAQPTQPTYRPQPPSQPTYRPAPTVSQPTRSSPSFSQPTYRPAPSVSQPSRSSSPSVSHGVRPSTPSVSRPSSPSRSSSPAGRRGR